MLAAGAAVLASLLTFDPRLYINGDNAEYLRMAERVLEGDPWPSSKYPPLFPYLLAPLQAVFGRSVLAPKILVFLSYAGAAMLLVPVFRRRLPHVTGSILLFAALTAVPVLEFSHYIMSEIPFLLTMAASIALADRWLSEGGGGRRPGSSTGSSTTGSSSSGSSSSRSSTTASSTTGSSPKGADRGPGADVGSATESTARGRQSSAFVSALRNPNAWILALAIAAGFYIRTAGAAVGAAIALVFLLQRRRGELVALLLLLVLFSLPWVLHSLTTPGGNPYFRQFLLVNPYYPEFGSLDAGSLFQRVRYNAVEYFRQIIPLSILPIPYRSTYSSYQMQQVLLPWPVATAIVGLLFAGILRGLWRRDVVAWSVFASLVLILLWPPIWAGSRFLVPFVPFFFLLMAQGGAAILDLPKLGSWVGIPVRRGISLALVLFLFVVSLVSINGYREETRSYSPEWGNYFAGVEWIRDNTPEDALVIDRKAIFVQWVADRPSRSFPRESDTDKMLAFFRESGTDYIIFPSLPYDDIQRYLVPTVAALQDHLSVEAAFGGLGNAPTYVFRFHPEGGQDAAR